MNNSARLHAIYTKETKTKMMDRFQYSNVQEIPSLSKIVINMGLGAEALDNANNLTNAVNQLTAIAGQTPVVVKAKRSVAGFKLREGSPIGTFVTLRGTRMWEFLDRLVTFSLPQVRDFRGLSPRGFDGMGNYNFGIEEQVIFPEVNVDKVDKFRGMNITIVTTAKTDEESLELLKLLGMPFRKSGK